MAAQLSSAQREQEEQEEEQQQEEVARAIWIAKPLQCHRLNGLAVQLPRPLDKHEHEHSDREWE
ncbi:GD10428 [Drosophila simulans]|uniref:GD10428 n=1 Tax=Drosophila simulans TaxID=7240 RepID=B4QDR3_DROSI|nr:GD10428 [Drosophila simulans]